MHPAGPLRVHQRLEGRGQAFAGERLLADVAYALKDVEELVYATPPRGVAPSAPAAGARNIYGLMRSPRPGVLAEYVGAQLVLHLEDGRVLPFTVAKVLRAGTYLIQGLGGVR
jgi:hypothetical protein